MEARFFRVFAVGVAAVGMMGAAGYQPQGTFQTANFVVTAPSAEIAKQVAEVAEVYRKELAKEWLGHELPNWSAKCPIKVKVGQIGAGGATTFSFHPNPRKPNSPAEVLSWDMNVQGTLERILDSVIPHEVSHTIFACHFRRPLPRWADEGAATLAEHESEKRRQVLTLQQVAKTNRRIPLRQLMAIKEYPQNMQDVMTLYAEGYSLAELLVQEKGKTTYLKFINEAHQNGWDKAIQAHYGYRNVEDLEKRWLEWVMAGSPELNIPEGSQLAKAEAPQRVRGAKPAVVRGQNSQLEEDPFLGPEAISLDDRAKPENDGKLHAPLPRALPRSKTQPRKESVARQTLGEPALRGLRPMPRNDGWQTDDGAAASEFANARSEVDDFNAEFSHAVTEPELIPAKRTANGHSREPAALATEQPRGQRSAAQVAQAGSRRAATPRSEFPQEQRWSPLETDGKK